MVDENDDLPELVAYDDCKTDFVLDIIEISPALQEKSIETIATSFVTIQEESVVVIQNFFIASRCYKECGKGIADGLPVSAINKCAKDARAASNAYQKSHDKCLLAFRKATKALEIHVTHYNSAESNTRTQCYLKHLWSDKLRADNTLQNEMQLLSTLADVNEDAIRNLAIRSTLAESTNIINMMSDILHDMCMSNFKEATKFADRTKRLADRYYNRCHKQNSP
jgi:hypothetical protein